LQPDLLTAQMAKLVDAADSKSAASNGVLVRFQFWALDLGQSNHCFGFYFSDSYFH
jgi:hypothetical protein